MASKKTAEVTPEEVASIEEVPTETPTGEETPQIELNLPKEEKEYPGHTTRAFRS